MEAGFSESVTPTSGGGQKGFGVQIMGPRGEDILRAWDEGVPRRGGGCLVVGAKNGWDCQLSRVFQLLAQASSTGFFSIA